MMINPSTLIAFEEGAVDIAGTIKTGFDTVYEQIQNIANPIATFAVAVCGVYLIFGSDPSYIKKAKSWGIAIFFGILVINFAPSLVSWALSALK